MIDCKKIAAQNVPDCDANIYKKFQILASFRTKKTKLNAKLKKLRFETKELNKFRFLYRQES